MKINIHNPLECYADDRRRQIRTAGGLTSGERLSRIKMEYLYWLVASMLLERYQGALYAKPCDDGEGVTTQLFFEMEQMKASPTDKLPVGGLSLEGQKIPTKSVTVIP